MKKVKTGTMPSFGSPFSMKSRSSIIMNYICAKIEFESIDNDDIVSSDMDHFKKAITDEVYPGIFEEAFGEVPKGFIAVGVCDQGSNIMVIYAAERFLKPATAVSSASAKFGLSDKSDDSVMMTNTFKKSDYMKYQYLLQKKREEAAMGGEWSLNPVDEVTSEGVDDSDFLPF